ncbi:hypothetical protein BD410DRAFT_840342 [Rickenella mellea]|uniref:Endoplasmic reticulum transmembrane protein n=1 Tax=Rickenella mellea TaxID=50990 RepID=A0A4Y7Q4B3_9AGAM|nr:hypothetical protein BD410DRAFT_840342 [Rickenella mellea]
MWKETNRFLLLSSATLSLVRLHLRVFIAGATAVLALLLAARVFMEEMRRTLKWLLVQSEAWIARGTLDTSNGREVSSHVQDGLTAYAHRQAAMYRALGVKFAKMWEGVPALVEREDEPTPPDDDDLPADFDHSPEAANIVAG